MMFGERIFESSSAPYSDRIIIIDKDNIISRYDYRKYFYHNGFSIIDYIDDLHLRVEHDDAINGKNGKYLIISSPECYIPYDVQKRFRVYHLSFSVIFPLLDPETISRLTPEELDLLSAAYDSNYTDLRKKHQTIGYIRDTVKSEENVSSYLKIKTSDLLALADSAENYKDWRELAVLKSSIDTLAAQYGLETETDSIHGRFSGFILDRFGSLSSELEDESPVLVSRAMEYMYENSRKFAIIVMDGMSEFDWSILSAGFSDIVYSKTDIYAMIPTITSISRQCLLSNKFPSQLLDPWKQNKERQEFITCARSLGFTSEQIGYERGYNASFSPAIRCAAVIINDVDDMLHGQMQGRPGMYNDISLLAKQGKLTGLVKRLLHNGFDVYISADHGNTPCTGMGKYMSAGVETQTKSRRMIVLKGFADKQSLIQKYNMIEFPKYYLDKTFDYLICDTGTSFDTQGEKVISHGGITLDEVVVPFIKIKAAENNG